MKNPVDSKDKMTFVTEFSIFIALFMLAECLRKSCLRIQRYSLARIRDFGMLFQGMLNLITVLLL